MGDPSRVAALGHGQVEGMAVLLEEASVRVLSREHLGSKRFPNEFVGVGILPMAMPSKPPHQPAPQASATRIVSLTSGKTGPSRRKRATCFGSVGFGLADMALASKGRV